MYTLILGQDNGECLVPMTVSGLRFLNVFTFLEKEKEVYDRMDQRGMKV